MGLASNTRRLLERAPIADSAESTHVEYHLLSWRELYDKSIITADRYSSGAARWVIRGGKEFYTVTVVSRPYYSLPQELCLSFDCFMQEVETTGGGASVKQNWLPIEQVALEFSVLLSVFAREPLVPLGLRREGGQPIVEVPHKIYPPRVDRASAPIPFGINSPEFVSVLSGLAQASGDLVQAIVGAAKFYHAGLSLIGFDPSVAYVSLVSAIECLSGYHYKDRKFDFDAVPKFEKVRGILERFSEAGEAQDNVVQLKEELIRSEHFLRQKIVLFLTEHVTKEFWEAPDELYQYSTVFPEITRDNFDLCLREIYDARSIYLHGGLPYPDYVDFGLRQKSPAHVFTQLMELKGKQRFIPPLAWFERLSHVAIVQFMRRSLAPDITKAESSRLAEKEHLLMVISGLPGNVQDSLRKLVYWTARFLGVAVINPHAPNSEWADSPETVAILKTAKIIGGEGDGLQGSSWLKDREIGEIAGEFVFGAARNPFRGNELLLPKNWEQL